MITIPVDKAILFSPKIGGPQMLLNDLARCMVAVVGVLACPLVGAALESGAPLLALEISRPSDSYEHDTLEKAWEEFGAETENAQDDLEAALSKRYEAAVEAGDLEQAKKWGGIRDAFEESGVLAQDALAMPEVAKVQRRLDAAREKLAAAYERVVAELTKQKRLPDAEAVSNEKDTVFIDDQVYLVDLEPLDLDQLVDKKFFGLVNARVKGIHRPRSIGLHPPTNGASRVRYKVPAGNNVFIVGEAAMNDSAKQQASSVRFKILDDRDKPLWESRRLKGAGRSEKFRERLIQTQFITLEVFCQGDFGSAHAVWLEPRFLIQ